MSYTVRTLERYHGLYPQQTLAWLIGSDAFAEIHTWHRWRELFDLANFVVLSRPGVSVAYPPEVAELLELRRRSHLRDGEVGAVLCPDIARAEVSATEVRRRVSRGDGVADLVPPPVATYIEEHNLYARDVSEADALRDLIVDALDDRKGRDIVAVDVSAASDVTDHMVIVSGTSNRHVKALVDQVIDAAKDSGAVPLGVEGREAGEWVLLDLGDVVVHVMQPDTREFYDLERLWVQLPTDSEHTR